MSFITNIFDRVIEGENFREVIFTGEKSQLVIMSIPPLGEVGEETHEHVEQTLYIAEGICDVYLNDEIKEAKQGDVVVVTPNTKHNLINKGDMPLKIMTVYAPANHIDGRIHETKEDADRDEEDEEFGHRAR